MNIKDAIGHMLRGGKVSDISRVLYDEVVHLRKQRRVLYDAVPDGTNIPGSGLGLIAREIHEEKKEKQKVKKEITVDQAIQNSKACPGSMWGLLANEVERLREICESEDAIKKQLRLRQDSNCTHIQSLAATVVKLQERVNMKNKEIEHLRAVIKEKDKNRAELGDDWLAMYREYIK